MSESLKVGKNKTVVVVPKSNQEMPSESSQQEHTTWNVDELQAHPRQAELFPGLSHDQVQDLARDIETNGLQQPLESCRPACSGTGQFGIYLFELAAQPGGPRGGQLKNRAQAQ